MRFTGRARAVLLLGAGAFATGCASPPTLELQEARQAVSAARDLEADIYASDQYDLALMNLQMAEREIEDQDGVSAMARSYDRALSLIDATVEEAERAQVMAEDFKARIFLQAEATLPVARSALNDAFEAFAAARPILAFNEAQALDTQLLEANASLDLAQELLDSGALTDASARIGEILVTARAVETRSRFIVETNP
jgi:hypothetical protein